MGDARMDDTHAEFVDQLNALLATPVDQQLALYRAFLDHTVEHFAQEER
jgi:hemerythrin